MKNMIISGIVIGLLVASLPAIAADRNVDVINNTRKTIRTFYASRTTLRDWQENILKGDPIKPGETQPIDVDDGSGNCKFDFRAVFSDGTEAINENVDVCSVNSVTYQ